MSSCVCKISFKSVQVCGGCCEMFRGLTFGDSVSFSPNMLRLLIYMNSLVLLANDWYSIYLSIVAL